MKKIVFSLLLAFLPFLSSAQLVVDGVNLNDEPDVFFVTAWITESNVFMKRKAFLTIDYGQEKWKNSTIEKDGNRKNFYSLPGCINWLVSKGWEPWSYLDAQITEAGNVQKIIFYKRPQN